MDFQEDPWIENMASPYSVGWETVKATLAVVTSQNKFKRQQPVTAEQRTNWLIQAVHSCSSVNSVHFYVFISWKVLYASVHYLVF